MSLQFFQGPGGMAGNGMNSIDDFFSNVFNPNVMTMRAGGNRPLGSMLDEGGRAAVPRHINMDIKEDKGVFNIIADLPGCQKTDVKLDLDQDENLLTIGVEKKFEKEEKFPENEEEESFPKWHRIERCTNFASRTLRLPETIDLKTFNAKMDHGVLTITASKKPPPTEEDPVRRIPIA